MEHYATVELDSQQFVAALFLPFLSSLFFFIGFSYYVCLFEFCN